MILLVSIVLVATALVGLLVGRLSPVPAGALTLAALLLLPAADLPDPPASVPGPYSASARAPVPGPDHRLPGPGPAFASRHASGPEFGPAPEPDLAGALPSTAVAATRGGAPGGAPGGTVRGYRHVIVHDPAVIRALEPTAAELRAAAAGRDVPADGPGPDTLLAALAWMAFAGAALAAVGARRLGRARDALVTALFVRLVGAGGDDAAAVPAGCPACEREGPGRRCRGCLARRSGRLRL